MSLTPPPATAGVWGRGPKQQTLGGSEAAPPKPPSWNWATRLGSGPKRQTGGDPNDKPGTTAPPKPPSRKSVTLTPSDDGNRRPKGGSPPPVRAGRGPLSRALRVTG